MDKKVLLFIRKTARVQAIIEEKDEELLLWMIGNYFEVKRINQIDRRLWSVYRDISLLEERVSLANVQEKVPDGPNGKFLLNSGKRILVINQGEKGANLFSLFRMIRSILRWEIYDESVLFLHGGFVELGGQGIAFLGNKKAGKTSSILSMIIYQGANFITNDDLMLDFENGIVAYGWPRSLSVRKNTLDILKISSKERIGQQIHPGNVYLKENKIDSEHEYYLPVEIGGLGSGELMSQTRLRHIVFPQFIDGNEKIAFIEKITGEEARVRLTENVRLNPEKYCGFMKEFYSLPDPGYVNSKIELLCQSINFYYLYQTFNALELGANQVRKAVGGGSGTM